MHIYSSHFSQQQLMAESIFDRNLIFGHKLEAFLDPSDSYFLFADLVGFYTH